MPLQPVSAQVAGVSELSPQDRDLLLDHLGPAGPSYALLARVDLIQPLQQDLQLLLQGQVLLVLREQQPHVIWGHKEGQVDERDRELFGDPLCERASGSPSGGK